MRSTFRFPGAICLAICCLILTVGCQKRFKTAYFGIKDEAMFAPRDFGKTAEVINTAKQTADSVYAQRKLEEAMKYGKQAAIVYWACHDQLAKNILAFARLSAFEAELYHPQPPPPAPKRMAALIESPSPPESLDPGIPFAGLKALPPPMILGTAYFGFDMYKLNAQAKAILDKNAPILKNITNYELEIAGHEIAGHTDFVGSDRYNQQLSELRATTVLYYLASKGVPPFKMLPVGYGENELLSASPSDEAQAKNRRAEIRLIGTMIPEFPVQNLKEIPVGTTIEVINFNYDDSQLLPVYDVVLNRLITAIKKSPNVYFELAGYTDPTEVGKNSVNLVSRRINSVRDYLVSNGVPPNRLKTSVYKNLQPIASTESSLGRRFNRRVEIKIIP